MISFLVSISLRCKLNVSTFYYEAEVGLISSKARTLLYQKLIGLFEAVLATILIALEIAKQE